MAEDSYFTKEYHDNCHDFLKPLYIELYAMPGSKAFLYEISNYVPKLDICSEMKDYDKTVVCDQHAVIMGTSTSDKPILATYALNSCIALVMYSPAHKIGAMTHFDGLPAYFKSTAALAGQKLSFDPIVVNMGMIIEKLKNHAKAPLDLKVWLVGGVFGLSELMLRDLITYLAEVKDVKIRLKGRNLLGPINQSRNIALDLRDGSIKYFDILEYGGEITKAPYTHPALLDITYNSL